MRALTCLLLLLLVSTPACGPLPVIVSGPPTSSGPHSLNPPSTTTQLAPTVWPTLPAGFSARGAWYELYFTDPTTPLAAQKTGGPDGPLAAAIDAAQLSVDIAIYSLSLDSIRDALVGAHDRGVQVRAVIESDSMDRIDPQWLIASGIPMLGDRREGLMHNKFVVIDRSEVWTGSMNFTDSGGYQDYNNLIRIHSTKVAEDYGTEFNEMFVDDRFGPDTVAATPNPRVTIDGTPLDIYFSPDDDVSDSLLDLLNGAQESIYFMAYSFTSDALGEAIRQRATAGVTVAGVMDQSQVLSNQGTEFDAFRQAGLLVRTDGIAGLMHHKVIIIDSQIVVTGSYNFTASAETRNDENLIVIYDPAIASQYLAEFRRVFGRAEP